MPSVLALFLILLAGFLIKIPLLIQPLAGYFASYQIVNAMMAEMMVQTGNFLVPKTFIVMDGKAALHLLYYPFGAACAALLTKIFGGSLDFWGRFQTAFFTFGSGWVLYKIALEKWGSRIALFSAFLFTFSPMVLMTSGLFQNEGAGIFFLLFSALILIKSSSSFASFAAGLIFSLALAARLHFIVVLPAFFLIRKEGRPLFRVSENFLFLLGTILPVTAWFWFTYVLDQQNQGSVMTSLFSQAGEGRVLMSPLFKNVEFYKKIFGTLNFLLLTPLFVPFFILGLIFVDKITFPFILWIFAVFSLIFLVPQKILDHPFYLLPAVPPGALLAATVWSRIAPLFHRIAIPLLGLLYLLFSLRFFVPIVLDVQDHKKLIEIGNYVQIHSEPQDKVIAQFGSGPHLLYYCKRLGWAFDLEMHKQKPTQQARHIKMFQAGYGNPITWLEHLKKQGARYLVISDPEHFKAMPNFHAYVENNHRSLPIVNSDFLVYDLAPNSP